MVPVAVAGKQQLHRTRAADFLGISVRTLYYRLNEYQRLGIDTRRKAGA